MRMNQIETLSMFIMTECDDLPNDFRSTEISNGKSSSIRDNGSSIANDDGDGHEKHCLDANESTAQPMKSVKFATLTCAATDTDADVDADTAADKRHIPSIAAYFSIIHDNQHRKMKNVENLFRTIGPILIKLESLVLDSSTGELDNMCLYYDFWEQQLFELLIRYFELLSLVCVRVCVFMVRVFSVSLFYLLVSKKQSIGLLASWPLFALHIVQTERGSHRPMLIIIFQFSFAHCAHTTHIRSVLIRLLYFAHAFYISHGQSINVLSSSNHRRCVFFHLGVAAFDVDHVNPKSMGMVCVCAFAFAMPIHQTGTNSN